jgi:hypothetical protein
VTLYSVNRQQNWRIGSGKEYRSIPVYLKESGLEIAPNKCQLCIFDNKKGATDGQWEITVHGEKVYSVKSIKFMRMHLKSNLDWENEIKAIVRKCKNSIKIVNCEANLVGSGSRNFNVTPQDIYKVEDGTRDIFIP